MAPLPGSTSTLEELSREKIIDDTTWLVYCCCEGVGLGPISNPLVASEAKNLCIRTSVSTTKIMDDDGLCGGVSIFLCLTQQAQIPPVEEAPTCACFGTKCGGSKGSTKWKSDLFKQNEIMDNTFWLYYFLCSGVGLNKMDQGIYANQFKELCCRGYTVIEPPVIDGILCSAVATELCFWSECQMPPAKGNPMIACCTWRMNKKKYAEGGSPSVGNVVGKPAQAEMN